MKLSDLLKSPSSFRAQIVAFIALMLALTMAVISFYNQRLEERTTDVVNKYIQEIPVAIDLVLRSLSEARDLYELVNRKDQNSLTIDSESIVRKIFIVDEEWKIYDSTNKDDIDKPYEPTDEAQPISPGELKAEIGKIGDKEFTKIKFPMTTSVEDEAGVPRSAKREV